MLYDPKWQEKNENELFLRNEPTPSLRALSYALRHREVWPKGFEWDFRSCRTCAMGLARQLWSEHIRGYEHQYMVTPLGMPHNDAYHLFMYRPTCSYHMPKVKPEHIAEAIDEYLASR